MYDPRIKDNRFPWIPLPVVGIVTFATNMVAATFGKYPDDVLKETDEYFRRLDKKFLIQIFFN